MTFRVAAAALLVAGAVWLPLTASHAPQEPAAPALTQDSERARAQAAAQRAAERIRALQRESDALVAEARGLLAHLRKLEIDRALRAEELAHIGAELVETRAALAETTTRAEALDAAAKSERPIVETRLVQLYKLGRAGYWRLLLDTDDVRSVGRAYRTASALLQIDRERVAAHARTLEALTRERQELEARARAIQGLQQRAGAARAAAERAVAAHNDLIAAVDERRDLNAQMTGELETAQMRLQRTVGGLADRPAGPAVLPLTGFRGVLPWPGDGVVVQRFGRPGAGRGRTARTGLELSMPEGRHARAVHEGRVAYAAPFTGYGNLVILEHGDETHSLYGHLRMVSVEVGDQVDAGETLGETGRNPNGNPALYFELRVDGRPVDPLQWLRKTP
jgi:murein hydrolase activator